MPKVKVNGVKLYFEERGEGYPIVFLHSLIWDHTMFERQVERLSREYRTINVDFRGHGNSECPDERYTLDLMVEDTLGLLKKLEVKEAHLIGLSMGGMTFMRIAARRPELVGGLVLMDTSADAEDPENKPLYKEFADSILEKGPKDYVDVVMSIMFSGRFLAKDPRAEEWRRKFLKIDTMGVSRATYAVLERDNILDEVSQIDAPTLVVVGEEDVATPPEKARELVEAIPDSRLLRVPESGHMTTVEMPETTTGGILDFLSQLETR